MNRWYRGVKRSKGFLSKKFVFCAGIVAGAAFLPSYDMTGKEDAAYNKRLESIGHMFSANAEDVCIDVRSRDAAMPRFSQFWNGKDHAGKPLTPQQEFLVRLLEKMDETDIGRKLNESAAAYETIWCVDENSGFDGYYVGYSKNVAVINPEKENEFQKPENSREEFNWLLRTAYEENAHAWQNNEWKAKVPEQAKPGHHLAWKVATEAAARVTTYSALYQHRQNNDHDAWHDNISYYSNNLIMRAFEQEIEKESEGAITVDAMWKAFDAFYDYDSLVKIYQAHYAEDAETAKGDQPIPAYIYADKMGHVPGIEGNYMQGRGFSPDKDRYGKMRSATAKLGA